MLNFKAFVLFSLFAFGKLYGNDFAYNFALSNENPYVKEAIFLEVNLTQTDNTKVMFFNFSPKKSDAYDFYQVAFSEDEKRHDLHQSYGYLIYAKKSGSVLIEFEMIKSITDDDKVAYAISGDRDNVKGLQKEDIVVKVEPLPIEVKRLPQGTNLVGDFTLTHNLDRKRTKAYDPINLSVALKGKGYLDSFPLLEEPKAYRLFTQEPKLKIAHTKRGSMASLQWDYAISAKEDFRLPKVALKAFNPKTQKSYILGFPAYDVKVETVEASTLLDREDYPARAKGIEWDFWTNFFSYLIVFVAGFLMPRDLLKRKAKTFKHEEDVLSAKIEEAKGHKELLKILLLENSGQYANAIEALEGVVYNGEKLSLAKIKERLKEEQKCNQTPI